MPVCAALFTVLSGRRGAERSTDSLFTLPQQQEVASEAVVTLVAHAVVLAVHTDHVILRGALGNPLDNLQ